MRRRFLLLATLGVLSTALALVLLLDAGSAEGTSRFRTGVSNTQASTSPATLERPHVGFEDLPAAGPIPHVITRAGNVIVVPPNGIRPDGSYDVVMHFHGIHPALEPALRESQLRAILLILELGIGPDVYSQRFFFPEAFDQLLKGIRNHVKDSYGVAEPKEGRIALSAWSAGNGAVAQLLRHERIRDRIDAVVLADALHVAFIDPKRRLPSEDQLEPYRELAEQAMVGKRLFGITHSSIQTSDFASTTETASWLLDRLGLVPVHPVLPGGPIIEARKGSFFVLGFKGDDKRAHAQQQWMMGQTLWSELKKRWEGEE